LAEFPKLVKNLLKHNDSAKSKEKGVWSVRLYIDGVQKDILVDDYIPWNEESNTPAFSRGVGELWVMIIEKAWAKINKC